MKPLKALGLSLALSTAFTLPAMAQYGHTNRGGGSAVVFANPDFSGQSLRVDGPITHLNRYRFNDKASSIRVRGGSWEVCTDPNFRGRCEVITYGEDRLNDIRLNDKITSIRPVAASYGGRYDRNPGYGRGNDHRRRGGQYGVNHNAPVVLFKDPDFRGNALPLDGAVPHLNPLRFNDSVSSIAVQNGAWEVCTDPNFRGRCQIITSSTSQLGYIRLNDNITSIRPAGRGYGYDRDRNRDYGRRW